MYMVKAVDVNDALLKGMILMSDQGVEMDTRNGKALVLPAPLTTIYEKPMQRVLFNEKRHCNPYFHFFEALWMLAGRNDVDFLSFFNKRMSEFSDDGETFHGAYGARWRNNGQDQLWTVINMLKVNPNDRRAVLQMWDHTMDLGFEGKDFPCNLIITFRVNKGNLDMHVFNRSNDMIWGAYGANAVHMSMLQEVVAAGIKAGVGRYYQISTNFHAYREVYDVLKEKLEEDTTFDNYETLGVQPYPMLRMGDDIGLFLDEIGLLIDEESAMGFQCEFIKQVAIPMLKSWMAHKNSKEFNLAYELSETIKADDWRIACQGWLKRMYKKC